jgi:hypothetical protein
MAVESACLRIEANCIDSNIKSKREKREKERERERERERACSFCSRLLGTGETNE